MFNNLQAKCFQPLFLCMVHLEIVEADLECHLSRFVYLSMRIRFVEDLDPRL